MRFIWSIPIGAACVVVAILSLHLLALPAPREIRLQYSARHANATLYAGAVRHRVGLDHVENTASPSDGMASERILHEPEQVELAGGDVLYPQLSYRGIHPDNKGFPLQRVDNDGLCGVDIDRPSHE